MEPRANDAVPTTQTLNAGVETFFRLSGRHLHRLGYRPSVANDRLRHIRSAPPASQRRTVSQSLDLQRNALQAPGSIRATNVFERVGESRMTPPAMSILSQVRPRLDRDAARGSRRGRLGDGRCPRCSPDWPSRKDVSLRAGIDVNRPADTHVTDAPTPCWLAGRDLYVQIPSAAMLARPPSTSTNFRMRFRVLPSSLPINALRTKRATRSSIRDISASITSRMAT